MGARPCVLTIQTNHPGRNLVPKHKTIKFDIVGEWYSTYTKWLFVYLIPDRIEIRNVGFWGEGKTGVPREKPLGAKERTNNKLNPHMASTLVFEPGPHWWEASAVTTALSLAPQTFIQGTPSVLKMWLISKRVDMFKFTLITITKTFTNWTISLKSIYYLCEFNI